MFSIKSQKNSIEARIYFSKKPYGGDVGMANAKICKDGYQLVLLHANGYDLEVRAKGYSTLVKTYSVDDHDLDGFINQDFFLEPITEAVTAPIIFEAELVTLKNLIFETDKASLTESSFLELNSLVNKMETSSKMVIQLEGHTDYGGNPRAAMNLSLARVEAIKDYLVKQGIKKKRIKLKAVRRQSATNS